MGINSFNESPMAKKLDSSRYIRVGDEIKEDEENMSSGSSNNLRKIKPVAIEV